MICMLVLRCFREVQVAGGDCAEATPELEYRLEQPGDGQRERRVGSEEKECSVDEPQDPGSTTSGEAVHEGEPGDQVGEEQGAAEAGPGHPDRARGEGCCNCKRGEQGKAGWIGHDRQVRPVAPKSPRGSRDATTEIEVEREDGHPIGCQRGRQSRDDEFSQGLDLLVA
jgi:hypothetical protein